MKRLLVIVAMLSLLLLTKEARAYDTTGYVWTADWLGGAEIPWVMNSDGCPDLSFSLTEEIMETSFDAWEDVDCSLIGFVYEGETDQAETTMDNVNLMIWRTSDWRYGMGVLGLTSTWFSMGRTTDSDIEFNSVHHTWDEGGVGSSTDLQSVATHEIGHLLGLDHSEYPSAVMYYAYSGGTAQRRLTDDDIAGICSLYPTGDGGCTTEAECPVGHECLAGDCVPLGGGVVCSRCVNDEQCGEGPDYCVDYPSDGSRCGRACDDDGDCDSAPGCEDRECECREISGANRRQCVAADLDCSEGPECDDENHCPSDLECVEGVCVEGGCTELGDDCEEHDDCCSSTCVSGICSQACDWLEPADSCPRGFYCSIRECGVGMCMRGSLGSDARGSSCESHEDCRTGYCASTGGPTTCHVACDPGGIETCPNDENCYQIGASNCGVCACQIGHLGDVCDDSGECASGLCATKSGDRRCSRFCASANPCPDGHDCLDAGRLSICWPEAGGLDAECSDDDECTDGLCVDGSCTRSCNNDCDCAVGFRCAEVDGDDVCVSGSRGDSGGCDCTTAGRRPGVSALLLAVLIGLIALPKLRRSH